MSDSPTCAVSKSSTTFLPRLSLPWAAPKGTHADHFYRTRDPWKRLLWPWASHRPGWSFSGPAEESEALPPQSFFLPLCYHTGQTCFAIESPSLPFPIYDPFILTCTPPINVVHITVFFCLLLGGSNGSTRTEFPDLVIR